MAALLAAALCLQLQVLANVDASLPSLQSPSSQYSVGCPQNHLPSCRLEVEVQAEGDSSAALDRLAVRAQLYRCDAAGEVEPAGEAAGLQAK